MKAYITIGLPASGKSTWAREKIANSKQIIFRINNDDIRNIIYDQLGYRNWGGAIEAQVAQMRQNQIRDAAEQGLDCVVDNTHMNPRTLKQTREYCESLGYTVETVDFRHVSVEECVQRDSLRVGHEQVGEQVIRRMYRQYGQLRNETALPRWQFQEGLPVAVIVDIDGTLAEMTDRGPYDEHAVYNDLVREHVARTVQALQYHQNCRIIVMSGRSEQCRAETSQWLDEKCGLVDYLLLMRAANDRRRDSLVKRELYDQHVAGRYSVLAVFDDRAQVIRECWGQLGLPVFRCGVIDQDDF